MTIGWLVIGTNRYIDLALNCLKTIRQNYNGSHDQSFFLFTDHPSSAIDSWIQCINIRHEIFPYITLNRYGHFKDAKSFLKRLDYLFYVDADMEFVDVGDEILGKRVVTIHPAFVKAPGPDCSFDRNPDCLAYVPSQYQGPYFQNCFQGGESAEFLRMCRRLARRIRVDLRNGVMPLWHDESHMNKYMIQHPPTRMLHPGYAFPDWWRGFNFERRIINIKKDAEALRAD